MNEFTEVDKCPVCKCADSKTVFRKESFKGKKCLNCGLVYSSPRLKSIEGVYKDDKSSSTSEYYTLSQNYDIETFTNRIRLLEKYTAKGELLDIGCSVGSLLAAAVRRGWNASGIEPNPVSAEICRNKHLPVFEDFLNESYSKEFAGHFDAVYLGDVLEHVVNPLETIGLALKVLKPNGILMIVTPDFDSFTARLFQIKPREHILYFTGDSIRKMFAYFNVKIELLQKTTRKRSLKALEYSSTFSDRPIFKKMVKLFSAAGLDSIINKFISLFIRDEILVILRKL
jgi:2-polyprenyl-3-methyl-5-hydroxy-6-metoxy-1,4-benzoquinol methylase